MSKADPQATGNTIKTKVDFDVMLTSGVHIQVDRIPEDQGGGFTAFTVPGSYTFVGDGDTAIGALEMLVETLKYMQRRYKR